MSENRTSGLANRTKICPVFGRLLLSICLKSGHIFVRFAKPDVRFSDIYCTVNVWNPDFGVFENRPVVKSSGFRTKRLKSGHKCLIPAIYVRISDVLSENRTLCPVFGLVPAERGTRNPGRTDESLNNLSGSTQKKGYHAFWYES